MSKTVRVGNNPGEYSSLQQVFDLSPRMKELTIHISEGATIHPAKYFSSNQQLHLRIIGEGKHDENGDTRPLILVSTNQAGLHISEKFLNVEISNVRLCCTGGMTSPNNASGIVIRPRHLPQRHLTRVRIVDCEITGCSKGIDIIGELPHGYIPQVSIEDTYISTCVSHKAVGINLNIVDRCLVQGCVIKNVGCSNQSKFNGILCGQNVNYFQCNCNIIQGVWGYCVKSSATNNNIDYCILDTGYIGGVLFQHPIKNSASNTISDTIIMRSGNLPSSPDTKANFNAGYSSIRSVNQNVKLTRSVSVLFETSDSKTHIRLDHNDINYENWSGKFILIGDTSSDQNTILKKMNQKGEWDDFTNKISQLSSIDHKQISSESDDSGIITLINDIDKLTNQSTPSSQKDIELRRLVREICLDMKIKK